MSIITVQLNNSQLIITTMDEKKEKEKVNYEKHEQLQANFTTAINKQLHWVT